MATAPDDAFDAFMRRHQARLARLAFLLVLNHADADELLGEAALRVLRKWEQVSDMDESAQIAYFLTTLRRLKANRWRALWRRERVVAELPEPTAAPDHAASTMRSLDVRRALAALPTVQRITVWLRYGEDLSQEEVARLLSTSVGAVKSNASKGLANLRALLPDYNEVTSHE